MKKQRPTAIDLFSGAGGLSLGFEQAGFDIVASIEIDPIHCAVHKYNFPYSQTICSSITNISGKTILDRISKNVGEIDVVVGGAPCQGFSMIGKRALDDPRNELVYHYIRMINEIKPKYFVFENVKGITIGKHKKFLTELIENLELSGYNVVKDYQVLNAADYGVPQNRKRLFLLGARHGLQLPNYPAKITGKSNVWDAIGDIPNADDFEELIENDAIKISYSSSTNYQKIMRCIINDPNDFSYNREFNKNILTSSMRTIHTEISKKRFSNTTFGKTEPVSRFHKLNPTGQCNTLRAGTNSDRGAFTSPRPIHPYHPRVITVREAARLHSYPDWFRFHVTKWHGFRQIGNSVPPLLGRAVGSSIVEALQIKSSKPSITISLESDYLLKFNMAEASKYFNVNSNVIEKRKRNVEFKEAING